MWLSQVKNNPDTLQQRNAQISHGQLTQQNGVQQLKRSKLLIYVASRINFTFIVPSERSTNQRLDSLDFIHVTSGKVMAIKKRKKMLLLGIVDGKTLTDSKRILESDQSPHVVWQCSCLWSYTHSFTRKQLHTESAGFYSTYSLFKKWK